MKLYSSNENYKLYQGNMLDMREAIEPNSIDSIITDPPYGLTSTVKRSGKENSAPVKDTKGGAFARLDKGFMGKEWDGSGIEYNIETWRRCYEVLKPGGYLLAFGGTRTFHRIACAIEDAGFEIRDTIMWLYGSGFPKSQNIGLMIDKRNGVESKVVGSNGTMQNLKEIGKITGHKMTLGQEGTENCERTENLVYEAQNEWNGWGTCLKPSYEPIIVARKPCEKTCIDNVLKYGVGGINIDECRVGNETIYSLTKDLSATHGNNWGAGTPTPLTGEKVEHTGRFPANTILTYDETDFEEVCAGFPDTKSVKETPNANHTFKGNKDAFTWGYKMRVGSGYDDNGSAARYFYCAKASKKDRNEGCELKNTHPTVKPTELMQYLIRLVTPEGGVVLDPFNGSGSTGKAAMYENKERHKNYKYIGIELTEEYLPIAKARIEYVCNKVEESDKQMSIFDLMGE